MASTIAPLGHGTESVAITGGKGGVGKSTLVLNLAAALGAWGRRVLLVDGDLGLANLDVMVGVTPKHNVEHLVRGEVSLDDVLVDGPRGVRILPAASGVPDLARMAPQVRSHLLAVLARSAASVDQVLIDTGAGLGETTLCLQLAASHVILVTTPEPTSLVDAYAGLKVLWTSQPGKPINVVVNAAQDDEEGYHAYLKIARAAEQFLGAKPGWLGTVYRDANVGRAVCRQRALLDLYPDTPAARCYERIAANLAPPRPLAAGCLDYWKRLATPANEVLH